MPESPAAAMPPAGDPDEAPEELQGPQRQRSVLSSYVEGEFDDDRGDVVAYVQRSGRAMTSMALVQLGMSASMLYLAYEFRFGNDRIPTKDIFSALVGLVTGLCGVFAGLKRAELMTRAYFVLQLWLLATVTNYLYFVKDTDVRLSRLCDPRVSYSADVRSYECAELVAVNHGKIALAACGLVLSLAACLLTFDFEDALDDWDDQRKAELLVEKMAEAEEQTEQDLAGFDAPGDWPEPAELRAAPDAFVATGFADAKQAPEDNS